MEHHAVIVAGFGFRAGATAASLRDALERTGGTPDALATAADKARHPAFRALVRDLALPVTGLAPEHLRGQPTVTRSTASLTHRATPSLAEATALAAAGPGARLVGPRAVSADRMATCALATGASP
jgi:cobalt-precorrin 5A hydrolase